MHILVVDDENAIEKLIGSQLRKAGYGHVSFHDSKEAMNFFIGNHADLDLALLDANMPGMTGIQMADEMSKIKPGFPIILITGMLQEINTDNIKRVLYKPIPRDELLDTVRRCLYL